MRSMEKAGGPTDIMTGFKENFGILFEGKYTDHTLHPMYPYMKSYKISVTPFHPSDNEPNLRLFKDISREIA